jgi:enamine deaminase RidA (YjgF/YER057c/UK114 family)
MSITRHQITDGTKGRPIISRVAIHGNMVYLCGVTPDPVGDIKSQTKQVLQRIGPATRFTGLPGICQWRKALASSSIPESSL